MDWHQPQIAAHLRRRGLEHPSDRRRKNLTGGLRRNVSAKHTSRVRPEIAHAEFPVGVVKAVKWRATGSGPNQSASVARA